ncbi:MAG: hypothetical protein WBB28_01955 [Crinalium sp.]
MTDEQIIEVVKQIEEALTDPGKFRAWLSGRSPDYIIGRAGNAFQCPIAKYTTSLELGELEISGLTVDKKMVVVRFESDHNWFELTRWFDPGHHAIWSRKENGNKESITLNLPGINPDGFVWVEQFIQQIDSASKTYPESTKTWEEELFPYVSVQVALKVLDNISPVPN